jgi:hypothetical protein
LAGEGIVDLKEYVNGGFFAANSLPDGVDEEADG